MFQGRWKIGFTPYFTGDTEEAIDVLTKEGYDGIEWSAYQHFKSAEDLKELAKATRERGLEVSDLMCSRDLVSGNESVRDERVNSIIEKIGFAKEAAVKQINLFTGPTDWTSKEFGDNTAVVRIGKDIKEAKAWENVLWAFRRIVDAAEKNSIMVTVEPAFGMLVHDYYTLREFLGNFDSKYLAVNFDPSHPALYGNDVALAARRLGKRIRHIHVKDVIGKPGIIGEDFTFPRLGEGVIDWKDFFDALREIGYNDFLSIEYEPDNYIRNIWGGDWTIAAHEAKLELERLLSL
jgi:sugar phosphate isomerase/epimerase